MLALLSPAASVPIPLLKASPSAAPPVKPGSDSFDDVIAKALAHDQSQTESDSKPSQDQKKAPLQKDAASAGAVHNDSTAPDNLSAQAAMAPIALMPNEQAPAPTATSAPARPAPAAITGVSALTGSDSSGGTAPLAQRAETSTGDTATSDAKAATAVAAQTPSLLPSLAADSTKPVPQRPSAPAEPPQAPVSTPHQEPPAAESEPSVASSSAAGRDLQSMATDSPPEKTDAQLVAVAPQSSPPNSRSSNPSRSDPLGRQSSTISRQSPSSTSVGTSGAQQENLMQQAVKTSKSAGQAEQNLPGDGAMANNRQDMPAPAVASISLDQADKVTAFTATDSPATSAPAGISTSSTTGSTGPILDDTRQRTLEQTHDLVSAHALRLGESGNDIMRVVVEPGDGTRLSLELRQSSGGIQAQAQLQQGDYQLLNGHWGELQQRLEPQGVHLGALESPAQATSDNNQFKQPEPQASDEPAGKRAPVGVGSGSTLTEAPTGRSSRSKAHTGFESWA